MGIRFYRAYTPGNRNRSVSDFLEITKKKPEKSLTSYHHRARGRNNRGVITCQQRGGGHKRLYRQIDFKRDQRGIRGTVFSIEYDPNRNAHICSVLNLINNKFSYILAPKNLKIGDIIKSGSNCEPKNGYSLPLYKIPIGTYIYNISIKKKKICPDNKSCRHFLKITKKNINIFRNKTKLR